MSQATKPSQGTGFSGSLYMQLSDGTYEVINDANGNSIEYRGGTMATIATTGNTDAYFIAPFAATVESGIFSATDALAASDTNYITFSITNLGQAGAGSNAILAATAANTTQATGGSAIAANTKRTLTLNGTAANLVVAAGDRVRIRAAATGTLVNTVSFPITLLKLVPIAS